MGTFRRRTHAAIGFLYRLQALREAQAGGTSVLIGRGGDCDVQLQDDRVSRHHARIAPQGDGVYGIEDLSTNGVRVNHAMLDERARLDPGDRIYIEGYVIIYQPDDVPPQVLEEESTVLDELQPPAG